MAKLIGIYPFLAERLKIARNDAGLTQLQLSELLGLRRSAVSDYERGNARPSVDTLVNIARLTHKPIRFFVEEDTDQLMLEINYIKLKSTLDQALKEFEDIRATLKKFGIDYDRKD